MTDPIKEVHCVTAHRCRACNRLHQGYASEQKARICCAPCVTCGSKTFDGQALCQCCIEAERLATAQVVGEGLSGCFIDEWFFSDNYDWTEDEYFTGWLESQYICVSAYGCFARNNKAVIERAFCYKVVRPSMAEYVDNMLESLSGACCEDYEEDIAQQSLIMQGAARQVDAAHRLPEVFHPSYTSCHLVANELEMLIAERIKELNDE